MYRLSSVTNRAMRCSRSRMISTDLTLSGKPQLTKIVATIGPASEQLPMLSQVVDAGMRIMRINFSHATYEEADLRVKNLKLSPADGTEGSGINHHLRAVLLDTQGPEIRTGSFANGVKEVKLEIGQKVTLTINDEFRDKQSAEKVWLSYKDMLKTVKEGSLILLDDGAIEVKVESISREDVQNGEVQTSVVNSGVLGNKKGVNMPGLSVNLPAMSGKDKADILWGIKNDIDFIAASFTRKAADVYEIKEYVAELMARYHPKDYPHPHVISKIENTEALDNFDEILAASDGIMVARGDLGVEVPMETLTNIQKDLVRKCNQAGKPVIVATQMLESMQKNPRPTRAECTDVANAVLDGADCVMLSGESAKGKYPVKSVQMMAKIIEESEQNGSQYSTWVSTKPNGISPFQGTAYAVAEASKNIHAACIIVLSKSGRTAVNIAKYRPSVPIICFVPNSKIGRLLQVHRGIQPVVVPENLHTMSASDFVSAVNYTKTLGRCKPGDNVIVVGAEAGGQGVSNSLAMRVAYVV